jgi:acetylornithine/succinyldiaminopimelate/putrescine aminotransferase
VGALMIIDEIQPGFGRTGKLFGFENYNCVPDIIILGKGMGGGMPVGAFVASEAHMDLLSDNPKLGHITTFGGHPVIAAASLATLKEITETNLITETLDKGKTVPVTFGTSFDNRNSRKRIDAGSHDAASRNHE